MNRTSRREQLSTRPEDLFYHWTNAKRTWVSTRSSQIQVLDFLLEFDFWPVTDKATSTRAQTINADHFYIWWTIRYRLDMIGESILRSGSLFYKFLVAVWWCPGRMFGRTPVPPIAGSECISDSLFRGLAAGLDSHALGKWGSFENALRQTCDCPDADLLDFQKPQLETEVLINSS